MAQIDPPHCVLEIDDQFTPGPNPGPGPGPGILGWQVSRLLLDFDGSGFSRFTCTDWPLWEGITSSVLPSSSIHQPFAFCDGGPDPPTMTILESELESKSESEVGVGVGVRIGTSAKTKVFGDSDHMADTGSHPIPAASLSLFAFHPCVR